MLESRAEPGSGLLRPGYSVTRELCDDVSGGQSCIFTSGHRGEALSSWELDTGCRVLMAGGTGTVARAGTLVTHRATLEAGHIITKWDNIARCHLFADQ